MRDGEDFLKVASHLAQPPATLPPDAALRSSVGRSYYAAFNVAVALLARAGFDLGNGPDKHERVTGLLKGSTDEDVATAGSKLAQLRGRRNAADYVMSPPENAINAVREHGLAFDIVKRLRDAAARGAGLGLKRRT